MRVLHVIDHVDSVGGIQTYLSTLLPLLRGAGIDAAVVAADAGEIGGVAAHAVPGLDQDGAALPAGAKAELERALAEVRPDVVLSHVPAPGVPEVASTRAPVVVYPHDYSAMCPGAARYLHRSQSFCAEGPGLRCFWRAYTERTTNRRPDRLLRAYARVRRWQDAWADARSVVVASPFVADLVAAEGVARERIHVVAYPVATPPPGATAEPVDVLFVGRLVASKGVAILLNALAELPLTTAAVAGDGPDRPALEAQAAALGIADRVRFLGWVGAEERNGLLRAARVFVMPSLWDEAFGIAGVEALAAGTPVVATRVGGIPSWLRDEEGGLLVPRADSGALAGALARVLDDGPFGAAVAARASTAAARFSQERHLERLLPVLTDAL